MDAAGKSTGPRMMCSLCKLEQSGHGLAGIDAGAELHEEQY